MSARGIRKSYVGPGGRLEVLRGIDLDVPRGMLLAIVGASGSGKSTLLNVLGTLDHPDSGTLDLGGQRVNGLNEERLCEWRGAEAYDVRARIKRRLIHGSGNRWSSAAVVAARCRHRIVGIIAVRG